MRLSTLYPALSREEQEALAKAVESSPGYLWQLATRWRGKSASTAFIQRLAQAEPRLTVAELVAEFTEPAPAPATPEQEAKAA